MIRIETPRALAAIVLFLVATAAADAQRIPSDALPKALRAEVERVRKLPKKAAALRLPVIVRAVRALADAHPKVAFGLAKWVAKTDPNYGPGQVAFAELALANKRKADATKAAKRALETATDDASRVAAARLLGETLDPALPELERIEGDGPALVLVAMGDVDVLLLKAVRERMQKWIHMPVVVQGGGVALPMSERNPWLSELDGFRRALEGAWDAGASEAARACGADRSDLQRDQVVARVYRAWLVAKEDWRGLSEFEAGMRTKFRPAWIADTMTRELASHIGAYARDGVRYVGITAGDMISTRSQRSVLGWGGANLGVASYAQFSPDVREEKPDWEKLVVRLTKQALCTSAEVLQLGRCRTSSCPMHLGRFPTFERFDRKRAQPCPNCEMKLQLAK